MTQLAGVLLVLGVAACGGGGATPGDTDSGTPSPSVPTPSVQPTPSVTATEKASGSASNSAACKGLTSTHDVEHGEPGNLSDLTGRRMRVGRHDCYERFVFEMRGTGQVPWWSVGYRDPMVGQASGLPVPLRGKADLEVLVGVWTVTDFPGRPAEWPPFKGPDDIVTKGYEALREARNLYAYEGQTQIGLGLDRKRPFKAFWMDGPPRLVVDVYTGVSVE